MAVSCTRPLVALLLLMVVAGPLQAQADSEIRAASESQLPRKVLHAGDPAGLSAKFISGFADVASILGSYLRPAGETLAPGRSEADPSTFIPPNGVKQLQNLGEFHKALAANDKVIIYYRADWCGPCKFVAPVFQRLSNEYAGVAFYSVDVDSTPDIAQEVGIRAMPTFIAFKDGEKFGDLVGANSPGLIQLAHRLADS